MLRESTRAFSPSALKRTLAGGDVDEHGLGEVQHARHVDGLARREVEVGDRERAGVVEGEGVVLRRHIERGHDGTVADEHELGCGVEVLEAALVDVDDGGIVVAARLPRDEGEERLVVGGERHAVGRGAAEVDRVEGPVGLDPDEAAGGGEAHVDAV